MLLLAVLAALLVAAAASDLATRTIANGLNAAIALLAVPYWFALGLDPWPAMALQLALGLGCFLVFALFFALGVMGGADVKMIAALALWLPAGLLLQVLTVMAVIGGALTLGLWAWHRLRRSDLGAGIPYGVAIALAGLWGLHQHYLNQFVG